MPRPCNPGLAGLTVKQRAKIKGLKREFDRARKRDARLHARLYRAQLVTRQNNKDKRRLTTVVAARDENEEKLRKIIGALENLGLRLSQIASGMAVVDDYEDAAAEHQARKRVQDARRDRKDKSEKRARRLRQAFDDEFKKQRQAAKGARFKIGDVYAAVAKAHGVSTATARRAQPQKRSNVRPI